MDQAVRKKKPLFLRILFWFLCVVMLLVIAGYIAMQVSPYPKVWLIRYTFKQGGIKTNEDNKNLVPPGITAVLDKNYDNGNEDTFLDIYYPEKTDSALTTIVWVHGGGWVAGDKSELSNYCKILASKGYTVVALNYSLAPGSHYPVQIHQINKALGYLTAHSNEFHINPKKILLAGDSGGSHLAAVTANVISSHSYSEELDMTPAIDRSSLIGAILCCGPYDLKKADLKGPYGDFDKTVLWSLCGTKDFATDPAFETANIIHYIGAEFPPSFITVGNGDPLQAHSRELAQKLSDLGVYVDTLFFPSEYKPALPHEYQFNLNTKEGMLSFNRTLKFLAKLDSLE